MAKPKVLLLGKLPPPYMGPAIATHILLHSALRERYELHHVNTNVNETISTVGTRRVDKVWKILGIYKRFIAVVRNEQANLVLVPISQTTLGFLKDSVFILLSRMFGCRTVIQLRGGNLKNWLSTVSRPVRAYVEAVLRTAQGVIVLGDNLRHLFADYFPEDRIFVVPNGADYPMPSRASAGTAGPVHVLYLANLQPSKGIQDVIQGVALLKQQGLNSFTVDVVGAWRDELTKKHCLDLVATYQLPVTFHGPVYGDDKFAFLAQSDIFVFTPREPEGHPWVIIEALASGLPIVATDQGAITESVRENANGFIVEPHNPEQIADRLRRLIEQPALRQAQGNVSRQHYQDHFTEAKMVERLSGVFDRLLQGS